MLRFSLIQSENTGLICATETLSIGLEDRACRALPVAEASLGLLDLIEQRYQRPGNSRFIDDACWI